MKMVTTDKEYTLCSFMNTNKIAEMDNSLIFNLRIRLKCDVLLQYAPRHGDVERDIVAQKG